MVKPGALIVSTIETKTRYWTRKRILSWMVVAAIEIAAIAYLTRSDDVAEDIRKATVSPRLDGTHPCVFASISGGSVVTGLGRCATPTEHHGATDRFEADLRYAAFAVRQDDLSLNDVFDVPLTRSYFSYDWIAPNPVHAFGLNTNHPYDVGPVGTRRPYTHMLLVLEDGDFLYFKRVSRGTGFADAVYLHTETSTRFYKSTIRWNGDGWTLRLSDGAEMHFPEAYNAKNSAQGALIEMRDSSGDILALQRDAERNLQQILTPHGHWIRFHYDGQSRIVQAEDDNANSVKYAYNSDGMLASAIHSSGAKRDYDYDGRLMTAVRDEHGTTLVRNWYESKQLVRQLFANGDEYRYSYTWSDNGTYVERVVVTLPDHSTRQIGLADSVPDAILKP
jgi:YD repeat-containing protein